MTQYDFQSYKQDTLTRPRDKAWDTWQKWPTIGTMVQGYIRDVFFKVDDKGKPQRCLTLEKPDGTLINVGIKHLDFVLAKTDNLRLNDPVTIIYSKDIPTKIKGNNPAKDYEFFGKNLPENLHQKTVAQLEDEDKGIAATANAEKAAAAAEADAQFNGGPVVETTTADVPFPSPSDTPTEEVQN